MVMMIYTLVKYIPFYLVPIRPVSRSSTPICNCRFEGPSRLPMYLPKIDYRRKVCQPGNLIQKGLLKNGQGASPDWVRYNVTWPTRTGQKV